MVDTNGTLRRNNFESNGNQPVMENVESLQFQYGLDTNSDGTIDTWANSVAGNEKVVKAVKIWLLVRGAVPDADMSLDTRTYVMGDRSYTPPVALQRFRRVLLTTTVNLRNYYLGS